MVIDYRRQGQSHTLLLDREGIWYTSIHFKGIGSIRFFSDEARTVVREILDGKKGPKLVERYQCWTYSCSRLKFDGGEEISIYSSDLPKLNSVFSF